MNGGYLLDTNIPSELMRPRPEPKVKDWVAAQDISPLFLSVVSIGELETGFTTMPDAARRKRLELSLERHLAVLFPGRVLPVSMVIKSRKLRPRLIAVFELLQTPEKGKALGRPPIGRRP